MDTHSQHPDVVQLAVLALTNLLCDLTDNVNAMVDAGGIAAMKKALEAHPNNPRMLEDAMCCLSNLLSVLSLHTQPPGAWLWTTCVP